MWRVLKKEKKESMSERSRREEVTESTASGAVLSEQVSRAGVGKYYGRLRD